mgnify:FL=1
MTKNMNILKKLNETILQVKELQRQMAQNDTIEPKAPN